MSLEHLQKKVRNFLNFDRTFLLYLGGISVFLIALNFALWPTPDEYFYLSVSDAIENSFHSWNIVATLNTEHVAFVPFVVALFNALVNDRSFVMSSIPIIFFSLGTVLLFYLIARKIGLDRATSMRWMWLLLLISGFWMFSTRLMLDIPATFAFTFLLYLLLRRSHALLITLAVVFVLVTKEYYFYLTIPIIIGMSFFDLLLEKGRLFFRILKSIGKNIVIYLPSLFVMVLFLNFNFLPYPRLLEASLQVLFGDAYTLSQKFALRIMGESTEVVSYALESVDSLSQEELEQREKRAENFVSKSDEFQLSGNIPTGIVDSNNPDPVDSPWYKWWLVYRYNLSEDDVNVFILPLALLGIGLSFGKIRRLMRSSYREVRTDILFLLVLLVFMYFNYHQADWRHGFRIIIPMTSALIYFSSIGVGALLEKPKRKHQIIFCGLFIMSIILYLIFISSLSYGGILANSGIIAPLLRYKPYIFTAFFVSICLYLLYYARFTFSRKRLVLLGAVVAMFTIKFGFLFGNSILLARAYEYDYGASHASPLLREIGLRNQKVYGNMHPYRIQYYAQDPRIPSMHIGPAVRDIRPRNPKLYFGGAIDENMIEFLQANEIQFVFVVINGFTDGEIEKMEGIVREHPEEFVQRNEYRDRSGKVLWRLYEFIP